MALPTLLRKLFKNDGYGPEIKDENLSLDVTVQDWSASHDYSVNTIVKSGSFVYRAKAASGPGTAAGAVNPANDSQRTYWAGLTSFDDVEYYVQNQGYAPDSNVVHKTGVESIGGYKTFTTSRINIQEDAQTDGAWVWLESNKLYQDNYPSYASYFGGSLINSIPSNAWLAGYLTWGDATRFECVILNNISSQWPISVHLNFNNQNIASFYPEPTNSVQLGSSGRKWSEIFASTGTINTSDERLKTQIAGIPDEILDAWGGVNFIQYKFIESVDAKGQTARLHSGLVAQQIDAAFKARNLDVSKYGLFCHDEWDAEPERRDANGNLIQRAAPAGEQFSLRYEEALCVEAAYQRRRADRAEARISALEARLAALEAKLGG